MKKYEKMVLRNKEVNAQKADLAIRIIQAMVEQDEKVTVQKLIDRTGLSRSLFYYNPVVREELDRAKRAQCGKTYAREEAVILDQALLLQIRILKRELHALKCENRELLQKLRENGLDA